MHSSIMENSFSEIKLPTGTLSFSVERTAFPVEDLVGWAARDNAKRGFLFMSKVLGKHWPVTPSGMLQIHEYLTDSLPANTHGPVLFIAMAETAIGLGHGVFEAFKRKHPDADAMFIHTSRYRVEGAEFVDFEESHSHAPQQVLHLPVDPALRDKFLSAKTLVMIDDEVSTGNTFINLAMAYRKLNPDLERVHWATITDFMGCTAREKIKNKFDIPLTTSSVLEGSYLFTEEMGRKVSTSPLTFGSCLRAGCGEHHGRIGLETPSSIPENLRIHCASKIKPQETVLVLGTGEFMHQAFLLALHMEKIGINVVVQSTTRSPILKWGAAREKLSFTDNYGEGIPNYLYNVTSDMYNHVFICHETDINESLISLSELLGADLIHFRDQHNVTITKNQS